MSESILITGMVLSVMPVRDYDKRLTILTTDRGKITAFARGAKRQNSPLLAGTNPFCFGEFEVYPGRDAYGLGKTNISNYFRELATDYKSAYYGFYFLELAAYFAQENNDEKELLKLLYQSLRALESKKYENRLIKCIFELRVLLINGEYPSVFYCQKCKKETDLVYFSSEYNGTLCKNCGSKSLHLNLTESDLYTIQFILTAELKNLFSFAITPQVLTTLEKVTTSFLEKIVHHNFKSLKILKETAKNDFVG